MRVTDPRIRAARGPSSLRRVALLAAALVAAPPLLAQTPPAEGDVVEPAHFHHVRLNTTDREAAIEFYARHLGAVPIEYRGRVPALFTERSFLLFDEVETPPRTGPVTVISHIGWGGKDGPAEFEWLKKQGVEFQTPLGRLGDNYGFYLYGPDRELVEVWTGGQHNRFDHVHLWATDVAASTKWFAEHLGLRGRIGPKPKTKDRENIASIWMSFIQADNVNIVFFGRPDFDSVWWPGSNYTAEDAPEEFEPTDGYVINHLGFSYRDIEPVYERMKEAGVEIVEPISVKEDTGIKSFFVLAPDKLLLEIVEEKPIPEGVWE